MGKLYINNFLIELPPDFKFARTKQANDIAKGLSNRQTNYTQSIKIPKTKNNIKAFSFLGALGNSSSVPYSINNVRYVNESGVDEIFNGTAIVKNTNKYYNISIYDGYISFFKAIENRVLTDIGLSSLNHLKNVDTIIDTWDNDFDYRYNVADYNGDAIFDDGINADYLVPSVKFSFLWQKVHEYAGFTYEGSIFNEELFNDLWITYPKSIGDGSQATAAILDVTKTESELEDPVISLYEPRLLVHESTTIDITDDQYIETTSASLPNGNYSINLTITVKKDSVFKISSTGIVDSALNVNGVPVTDLNIVISRGRGEDSVTVALLEFSVGSSIEFVHYLDVLVGDTLYIGISEQGGAFSNVNWSGNLHTILAVVTGNVIDFEEAFIDFGLKKFINEGLFLFSLTPFKDKYTNHIRYLTTDEVINNNDVVDWSSSKGKYVEGSGETYILKGYAQRNNFKYKYNDSNFNHNDGYILIGNGNLKDETDVVKSNLFSPDALKSELLTNEYNVYPIWNKEPKEDGSIKYKELSNRFYIMGADEVIEPLKLTSRITSEVRNVSSYYRENFNELSFQEVISAYYTPLISVLENVRMLSARVYLNDNDIANLDFSKPVFIREQAGFFLINKVSNYIKKGVNKVELTEINRTVVVSPPVFGREIAIESVSVPPSGSVFDWVVHTSIEFINYVPNAFVVIRMKPIGDPNNSFDSSVVLNGTGSATHEFAFKPPLSGSFSGQFEVEVVDDNYNTRSNIEEVSLPDSLTEFQFVRFWINTQGELDPEDDPFFRIMKYEFFNYSINSTSVTIEVDDQPIQAADPSSPVGQRETFVAFEDGFKEYTIRIKGDGRTRTQTLLIN